MINIHNLVFSVCNFVRGNLMYLRARVICVMNDIRLAFGDKNSLCHRNCGNTNSLKLNETVNNL